MTKIDEEFLKKLRQTFELEAKEYLRKISASVFELEKAPPESRAPGNPGVGVSGNAQPQRCCALSDAARCRGDLPVV